MKKLTAKLISARLTRYVQQVLHRGDVQLIAVTGSIGKTSARAAISLVLSAKYRVKYSENSYNVPIAIELSFFGLSVPSPVWNATAWQHIFRQIRELVDNFPYDVVVIEVNEDDFDLLEGLVTKLHPNISVITGVAPAHMAKLKTMSRVAEQTLAIGRHTDKVIYNADFAELAPLIEHKSAQSYSLHDRADVHFSGIKRQSDGFLTANLHMGNQTKLIKTSLIADQSLYSLLAAAAVANELDLKTNDIVSSLASIRSVPGRMNLLPAINGAKIIDDSYNSSPYAAIAALRTLTEFPAQRRIAVLGSMNELGETAPESHRQVGKAAAKVCDLVVTVGTTAEEYLASAALKAGMNKSNIKIFRTPYEAGHYLKNQLTRGDVVLVKGSQNGVFTEEVSRILLDPKLNPSDVLVRQSPAWLKQKKKAFRL